MTEIQHQALQPYLTEASSSGFTPVYLLFGDAFLYEQAVKQIVHAIIPDPKTQRHGYEIIQHHESSQILDAIEKLNTYGFFNPKKIIELRDSNVFISVRNTGSLLQKIKKAYDRAEIYLAVEYYLELLGKMNIRIDDVSDKNLFELLHVDADEFTDVDWLRKVHQEARATPHSPAYCSDDAKILENAIVKGFPQNHHLIITTDTIDKKTSLYQTIHHHGTIIDCSVPKGTKKADKNKQKQTLMDYMNQVLKPLQKKMNADAFELFYEKIGFDIRSFANGLEKIIQYAGGKAVIDTHDVEAVSQHGRQDPLYELTGAIGDKNLQKTLRVLSSLLDSGVHPLQILAAMTNQMRKLLIIHDFLTRAYGKPFQGVRFDEFQRDVIPLIRQYDDALLGFLQENPSDFMDHISESPPVAASRKNISSDLLMLRKDSHPYSLYILFQNANMFEYDEIINNIKLLSQADALMKISGQRPDAVLQEMVITICRPRLV